MSAMRQEKADQLLEVLLEYEINHIDVAASYGDAELRVAPWMARHRDRFFLATKTGERSGDGARASLERSLARMGVDRVDLIQLHNLVEEEEFATAHGRGGAVEALARARDEGLVRFIGVTGHGLRIAGMHLRSLDRFDLDAVLLPYSYVLSREESYRADFEAVLEVAGERGVAVQTIKSVARRRWEHEGSGGHSWYEPLRDGEAVARAVRFVLSTPGVFLNSSSDATVLRPILDAASGPDAAVAPPESELSADVESLAIRPLFDGDRLERI